MLKKRSLLLFGHATSVALEPEFWNILENHANDLRLPLSRILEKIDQDRDSEQNLASALRVAALRILQERQI